ncbi:MAG TPA: aminotransferase class IV, partial [Pirellulaceae bacterium]
RLVISETRQVSPRKWPPELKCRRRMHYYLAAREARARDPAARALLLDLDGFVSEASTANVFAYIQDEGFVSPLRSKILPGVTLDVLRDLAGDLGWTFRERDLLPADLCAADEVLLCSTSPCLLPVVSLDGQPIGHGRPGPAFHRLLRAFGNGVGVDIAEQARRCA